MPDDHADTIGTAPAAPRDWTTDPDRFADPTAEQAAPRRRRTPQPRTIATAALGLAALTAVVTWGPETVEAIDQGGSNAGAFFTNLGSETVAAVHRATDTSAAAPAAATTPDSTALVAWLATSDDHDTLTGTVTGGQHAGPTFVVGTRIRSSSVNDEGAQAIGKTICAAASTYLLESSRFAPILVVSEDGRAITTRPDLASPCTTAP